MFLWRCWLIPPGVCRSILISFGSIRDFHFLGAGLLYTVVKVVVFVFVAPFGVRRLAGL